MKKKRDLFLYVGGFIFLAAFVVLIIAVVFFMREQSARIERNTQEIQDQKQPCQQEDVLYPNLSPGCIDGQSSNGSVTSPQPAGRTQTPQKVQTPTQRNTGAQNGSNSQDPQEPNLIERSIDVIQDTVGQIF